LVCLNRRETNLHKTCRQFEIFCDQAIKEIDVWQWQKKWSLVFGSAGVLIEYATTLNTFADEENRPAIRCLIIADVSNTVMINRCFVRLARFVD